MVEDPEFGGSAAKADCSGDDAAASVAALAPMAEDTSSAAFPRALLPLTSISRTRSHRFGGADATASANRLSRVSVHFSSAPDTDTSVRISAGGSGRSTNSASASALVPAEDTLCLIVLTRLPREGARRPERDRCDQEVATEGHETSGGGGALYYHFGSTRRRIIMAWICRK